MRNRRQRQVGQPVPAAANTQVKSLDDFTGLDMAANRECPALLRKQPDAGSQSKFA
ncbi:hypothetical protein TPL01_20110 [Sulfuriferula plumbiphila]|uniref:Uncharacterized protein n=1 Tax=Sulfuriferula plumbiphila TaxID=171865 RepID=A0A512L8T6_9PROT|nr:hypothetical protein [Sulfuriferula plumbiphila]BBP04298.1 hypothetical protein SFPGR_17200 [Sulfuriferula plumbiphila]GEP30873.1 hypothetical protein TPL01_20110 [Sulfuriferula plumbiphila]